ncbi:MAG: Clp protease N-terminal domain-containing protein [Armatimonadota bacterium]
MFKRFTMRARRVVIHAQEEARRLNRASVGPEHLFLAIAAEREGIGGKVLTKLGTSLDSARDIVESLGGRGDRPAKKKELGFSEDGKKALEFALAEARRLKHNYIGTEHFLLGLFRLESGPIKNVLEQAQLTHEHVQDQVIQLLALPGGPAFRELAEGRTNVVMCRVNDRDLEAIDTLIEAGVRATRSDAAAWLIQTGIEGSKPLFDKLHATVVEIRQLREQAKEIARRLDLEQTGRSEPTPPESPQPPEGEGPTGEGPGA